jgi:hypothetical protein
MGGLPLLLLPLLFSGDCDDEEEEDAIGAVSLLALVFEPDELNLAGARARLRVKGLSSLVPLLTPALPGAAPGCNERPPLAPPLPEPEPEPECGPPPRGLARLPARTSSSLWALNAPRMALYAWALANPSAHARRCAKAVSTWLTFFSSMSLVTGLTSTHSTLWRMESLTSLPVNPE